MRLAVSISSEGGSITMGLLLSTISLPSTSCSSSLGRRSSSASVRPDPEELGFGAGGMGQRKGPAPNLFVKGDRARTLTSNRQFFGGDGDAIPSPAFISTTPAELPGLHWASS